MLLKNILYILTFLELEKLDQYVYISTLFGYKCRKVSVNPHAKRAVIHQINELRIKDILCSVFLCFRVKKPRTETHSAFCDRESIHCVVIFNRSKSHECSSNGTQCMYCTILVSRPMLTEQGRRRRSIHKHRVKDIRFINCQLLFRVKPALGLVPLGEAWELSLSLSLSHFCGRTLLRLHISACFIRGKIKRHFAAPKYLIKQRHDGLLTCLPGKYSLPLSFYLSYSFSFAVFFFVILRLTIFFLYGNV